MKISYIEDDDVDFMSVKKYISSHIGQAQFNHYRFLNDFLDSDKAYDIVITDLGLPDAYGPEVLIKIRQITGKPIIVLSGVGGRNVSKDITQVIKHSGATFFLSKDQKDLKNLENILRNFI